MEQKLQHAQAEASREYIAVLERGRAATEAQRDAASRKYTAASRALIEYRREVAAGIAARNARFAAERERARTAAQRDYSEIAVSLIESDMRDHESF